MQVLDLVDEPADDHEVVEARRVAEPLLRLHQDAAARGDRLHGRREHVPRTEDRPRAVALVGGEPQHVDEVREGAEREAPRQDEADVEPCHREILLLSPAYSESDASIQPRTRPVSGIQGREASGDRHDALLPRPGRPGRPHRPEALDGAMARARAEGRLRRRHRRRRRARPRRRLLPGAGARDHQRRGHRQGVARRRQHRAQHHDHPLELPLRRERAHLRPRARPLGRPLPGAQLQRHVLEARGHDARAQPARHPVASSATSTRTG